MTLNKFDDLDNEIKKVIDSDLCSSEVANFIEEAVTFSGALWQLLKEHGMVTEGDIPNHAVMEQVIDRIYGELAAACMVLTDNSQTNVVSSLYIIADNLDKLNNDVVPKQLIAGFRDLAVRLQNTIKHKDQAARALKASKEVIT